MIAQLSTHSSALCFVVGAIHTVFASCPAASDNSVEERRLEEGVAVSLGKLVPSVSLLQQGLALHPRAGRQLQDLRFTISNTSLTSPIIPHIPPAPKLERVPHPRALNPVSQACSSPQDTCSTGQCCSPQRAVSQPRVGPPTSSLFSWDFGLHYTTIFCFCLFIFQ